MPDLAIHFRTVSANKTPMARSTVHYADKETNNTLKKLHNKLRPAGTPVQRVEYIIELLLLRIFEVKLVQDPEFEQLRGAFAGDNETLLFCSLLSLPNDQTSTNRSRNGLIDPTRIRASWCRWTS